MHIQTMCIRTMCIQASTHGSCCQVDCFVLLLTRDGSHGLDLSMLTHLFLADQCWDPSVEQQVISRAFRMGASGPVHVRQLLMRETLEETLHCMLLDAQRTDGNGGESSGGDAEIGDRDGDGSDDCKPRGKRRRIDHDAEAASPLMQRSGAAPATPPTVRLPAVCEECSEDSPSMAPSQTSWVDRLKEDAKVHLLLRSMRFVR